MATAEKITNPSKRMATLKLAGNHPRLRPYSALRQVGKGSYGEVFLVKHAREKKQFVMKNIKLTSSSAKERLAAEQEASLLSQLQHPNIVGYKESFQDEFGVLHIVMAYCEGGDLCTRLRAYRGQLLPEPQVVEWFVQIALALQYLHERNILHRDLKTQNIFLSKNDIIKVGDLGIARVLDGSCDLAHTVIGTPYYMSPELFANQPYNHKSDIWALGCCVYEMATLKHAFTARNLNALMVKIVQGKLPPLPAGQFSSDLSGLVKLMLSQDPNSRPTVHSILRMEFIRRHIKLFLERAAGRKRKSQKPPSSSSSSSSSSRGSSSTSSQAAPVSQEPPQTRDIQAPAPEALQKRRRSSSSEGSSPSIPPRHQQQQQQQRGGGSKKRLVQQRCRKGDGGGAEESPEPHSRERASRNKPPRPLPPDPVSSSSSEEKTRQKAQPQDNQPASPSAVAVLSARERRRRSKQEGGGRGRVVLRSRPSPSSSEASKKDGSEAPPTASGEDCIDGPAEATESELKTAASDSAAVLTSEQNKDSRSHSEGGQPGSDTGDSTPEHSDSKPTENNSSAEREEAPAINSSNDGHSSENNGSAEREEAPAINGSNDGHSSDEVEEFYTLLDTTLYLPEPSPQQQTPEEGTLPVAKAAFTEHERCGQTTGVPSGRLADRIKALRMECERGLESSTLAQAYQLLEHGDPEEAEELLVKLLGEEQFLKFGAKLQQLKLCEESFFEL